MIIIQLKSITLSLAILFLTYSSDNLKAADVYDSNTGILSITKVAVGDTLYYKVLVTIDQVISIGSYGTDSYDTYESSKNLLTIPVVTVGSATYYNVSVTIRSVISIGSSCTGITNCTNSLYTAPASFADNITTSFQVSSLKSSNAFVNHNRYMISDSASLTSKTNFLTIGDTYIANQGYTVKSDSLSSKTTYASYLNKLVRVNADNYGYFRLDSYLHPNNSIDFDANDSNVVKFRNNFGKVSSYYGYLTFAYDNSTNYLQAKKRYLYRTTSGTSNNNNTIYTGTWTEDNNFSNTAQNYYLSYSNGIYKLVATPTSASKFYLYDSPLDLDIPTFINPKAIPYVNNGAAPSISKTSVAATEGTNGLICSQINSTYKNQVSAPGNDVTTKANAETKLESIKTQVESSGEKLRYSTSVYKTFREAALATKLVSDSIFDGTPGQNLVPYVYFTNEKDNSGKYHPFMIVVSYGNQASPNGLIDIPHPPGDGSGGYATSKVTRFSNLENYIIAIPMKDYGQVTAVTDNVYNKTLWSDVVNTTAPKDVYTYADTADNGILFNGAVMFPAFNNTLVPSHLFGELSASGCHVGQGGGGPHCHMDGYQSGQSLSFYNDSDYSGKQHPPIIGFGYDGIALFAKYRSVIDNSMLGYNVALDSFGGHNHDSIGYHYHAHTVENFTYLTFSGSTSMNVLMKGAYIGKTNSIPYFRTNTSFSNNKYLGGTAP